MQTSALAQLVPPTVQAGAEAQMGAVSIRISRQGPYPASVTMPPGPFLLFISNRSGTLVDTYSLILKPVLTPVAAASVAATEGNPATTTSSPTQTATAPASLLDLHSSQTSQRDHQLIQLLPGEYEIHFLSHPEWRVSITISPN